MRETIDFISERIVGAYSCRQFGCSNKVKKEGDNCRICQNQLDELTNESCEEDSELNNNSDHER